MDPIALFRLQEYRISEFGSGRLSWESHSGFGSQVGGPCYIWGDILVIGNKCSEEIGFLKSEFLDSLKKLPTWRKTRFYCPASSLLEVSKERAVSEVRLMQTPRYSGPYSSSIDTVNIEEPIFFRLGHYRIRWTPDGDLHWYSSGGGQRIIGGPGIIVSDILFLADGVEEKTRKNKRDFIDALRELPKWDRTTLWCRSLALKSVLPEEKRVLNSLAVQRAPTSPKKTKLDLKQSPGYHRRLWSSMASPFFADGHGKKVKWSIKDLIKRIHAIRNKIDYVLGLITKR